MTEPTKEMIEAGKGALLTMLRAPAHNGEPLDYEATVGHIYTAMSAASADDEMVERVAIECHHASCANVPQPRPDYQREWYPWDGLHDNAKNAWRAIAKAALAAVKLEGVGEP